MQDRPSAIELLEAAAQFVEREIVPNTEGQRQFQSRVVANVMRIVAREIADSDSMMRSEVKMLAELLGQERPHLHGIEDVRRAEMTLAEELSGRIRAGGADSGDVRRGIIAATRQLVENKLKIDNPRYLESDIKIRPKLASK
jgi:Domain of unknown function (DUF6285)